MATGLEKDLSKRTLNSQSNVQNCLTPPLLDLSFERSGDHVWTIISVLYSVSSSCTLQPETLVETVRWHYLTIKMSVSCCRNEPWPVKLRKTRSSPLLDFKWLKRKEKRRKKIVIQQLKIWIDLKDTFLQQINAERKRRWKKNVCILY